MKVGHTSRQRLLRTQDAVDEIVHPNWHVCTWEIHNGIGPTSDLCFTGIVCIENPCFVIASYPMKRKNS